MHAIMYLQSNVTRMSTKASSSHGKRKNAVCMGLRPGLPCCLCSKHGQHVLLLLKGVVALWSEPGLGDEGLQIATWTWFRTGLQHAALDCPTLCQLCIDQGT
eukprot:366340-Chlamydomonas_euryale.AAC.3